jgi:CHASE2 domain-containing sensor protein
MEQIFMGISRERWKDAIRFLKIFGQGALGALTVVVTFLIVDLPHGPEHWTSDLQTAWLSKRPSGHHNRIALIEISDATLRNLPSVSPVDRRILADLVRTVAGSGATAIGLDFVIDRETDLAKDQDLIEAVRSAGIPIVVGHVDKRSFAYEREFEFQDLFFKRSGAVRGHVYFGGRGEPWLVSDSVVREISESDTSGPSLAEAISSSSGGPSHLNTRRIAWLLMPNRPSDVEPFVTIDASAVPLLESALLRQLFNDKIVLIGGNFYDRDRHLTPLSLRSGERLPGYVIHAQALAQTLDRRSVDTLEGRYHFLAILMAVFIGIWLSRLEWCEQNHALVDLGAALCLGLTSAVLFWGWSFNLPFVSILIGFAAGVGASSFARKVARHHLPSGREVINAP